MIRLCGYQPGIDIPIEITGMLPGEKLSEAVIGPTERRVEGEDGPILTIEARPLEPSVLAEALDRLEALALTNDRSAARAALLDVAAPALRRSMRRTNANGDAVPHVPEPAPAMGATTEADSPTRLV